MADLMTAEAVLWDGKPETVELLRERMPECLDSYWPGDVLRVRTLRRVTENGVRHDTAPVPLGWYLTRRTCRVHKQQYAAIERVPRAGAAGCPPSSPASQPIRASRVKRAR